MIGYFILLVLLSWHIASYFTNIFAMPLYYLSYDYIIFLLILYIYNILTKQARYVARYPFFVLSIMYIFVSTESLLSLFNYNINAMPYIYSIIMVLVGLSYINSRSITSASYCESGTFIALKSRSGLLYFIGSLFFGKGKYNAQSIIHKGYEYTYAPQPYAKLNRFWKLIYKVFRYSQPVIVKKKFTLDKSITLLYTTKTDKQINKLLGTKWNIFNLCYRVFG
jgi:hypothetical protein